MRGAELGECSGEQVRLGQRDGQPEGSGLPRERHFLGHRVRPHSFLVGGRWDRSMLWHGIYRNAIECWLFFLADEESGLDTVADESVAAQRSLILYMDIYRIEQVIRNLITNAVGYLLVITTNIIKL